MISFTVPLIPPSVNHYVKHTRTGRSYITAEALAFKQALGVYSGSKMVRGKEFAVFIEVVLPKGKSGDVDNFPKLVLDGLAECGIFRNRNWERVSDAHVRQLSVKVDAKSRPDEGRTVISVSALQ